MYQDPEAVHVVSLSHWATGEDAKGKPIKSEWAFKRYRTRADNQAVINAAIVTKQNYSVREAKLAERRGEDYTPEITQDFQKDVGIARLEYMSKGWSGPEFLIPDGAPHEHAGTVPPCTAETINLLLSDTDLEEVESELKRVWAGRSPDAEAEFPKSA